MRYTRGKKQLSGSDIKRKFSHSRRRVKKERDETRGIKGRTKK